MKIFCFDCEKVNCLVCQVECHQGHKCLSVGEVSEKFKLHLGDIIEKITSCAEMCEEEMLKRDEENRLVLENFKSFESDVLKRAGVHQIHRGSKCQQVVDGNRNQEDEKLKEIEIQKDEVSRQMAMLESYKSDATEMVEKGSRVDICRNFQDMKTKSDELENKNISLGSAVGYIGCIFSQIHSFTFLETADNIVGKLSGKKQLLHYIVYSLLWNVVLFLLCFFDVTTEQELLV